MPEAVRMGVSAALDADQRPLGKSVAIVVTVDEAGNEVGREEELDGPTLALAIVHFADLDDGRRVSVGGPGEMRLELEGDVTLAELREDLRDFIFEDELRELDEEFTAEPRWEELSALLLAHGVEAGEEALAALPFVIEIDDAVLAAIDA
jgi:hypothetical protein